MISLSLVHVDSMSCEPIVRRAPDGSLILLCQCGGTEEPSPANRVYLFRSKDEGKSWSSGEDILPADPRALYQTEVFVYEKRIYVFMTAHSGRFCRCENFVLMSADGGYTWEKQKGFEGLPEFTFVRGGIIWGDKVIFPYHGFSVSKEEQERLASENKYIWESNVKEMECGVIQCEKGGYKIKKAFSLPVLREGKRRWAWFEPTIISLSDGSISMLVRIDGTGALWETRSTDGGSTWGQLNKTDIKSPNNKPKLLRGNGGEILLLHTPNDSIGIQNRFPLELWISRDDMKSWGKCRLSDFPGWYSYPDGFVTEDGHLLLAVDFNRHDIYFISCELHNEKFVY